MAINLAAIRDFLLPGLIEVYGEYPQIPAEWNGVFTRVKSTKAFERAAEARYLGLAQLKNEGQQMAFDNSAGENAVYNATNFTVALGYAVTQEAIEDNQYETEFKPNALGLRNSFLQVKNAFAADILNTGSVVNTSVGGDGVALMSTAHPVSGSLIGNRPAVDVDLNEASLLSAQIAIKSNFRDAAGIRINAGAKMLVVPVALEPTALRLTRAELRPGTSDNDPNVIPMMGLNIAPKVMRYLTSPFAWFLTTDITSGGLVYYDRIPFSMDMDTDFTTTNLLVRGRERYCFGTQGWRGIYGSFPTS